MARGKHLFPFRTEKLSLSAPMVLGSQGPGRVGRRRFNVRRAAFGRLVVVPGPPAAYTRRRMRSLGAGPITPALHGARTGAVVGTAAATGALGLHLPAPRGPAGSPQDPRRASVPTLGASGVRRAAASAVWCPLPVGSATSFHLVERGCGTSG